jgi:hypothetical protein
MLIRLSAVSLLLATALPAPLCAADSWWKGNLHTHSLWSDGDDYPEMVAAWYRGHGYNFLAVSDHNTLQIHDRWIDPASKKGGSPALDKYLARFGADWVEQRVRDGKTEVRLKRLEEYRGKFEAPGVFLLMGGEEISDRYQTWPVHLNAHNIVEQIEPRGGDSVLEVMQNNVDAVLEQRRRTGLPMLVHLNHPNFNWAVTAEEIAAVKGERFFEVYNGHPIVHNDGDATHPGTERLWDIALTRRLSQGGEILYGIATDDSHNYHVISPKKSNAGRGWIMVRSGELSVAKLIAAMEAGEFYASSGVVLDGLHNNGKQMAVEIAAEPGVDYAIQFIGTRRGYDDRSEPVKSPDGGDQRVTRRYSSDVGKVLAEARGTSARYSFAGDELYVRAHIVSTKRKENSPVEGEFEQAWTQPATPAIN